MTQWREPPVLLVLRCGLLHASVEERLTHRARCLRELAVELPRGCWLRQSPGFAGTPLVEHQCMRMLQLAAGNGPLN